MDNRLIRPNPKTQAGRLLAALEDRRGGGLCALDLLTDFELYGISHRYAASALVLRDLGYNITTTKCPLLEYSHHHAPGLAFYTLEEPIVGTLF